MPTRRNFIRFLGVTSAVAIGGRVRGANPPTGDGSSRPNVIFVLADQWRGSALEMGPANDNSYAGTGNQTLATPRLKAFGGQGTRLDRCYATKPVCTPNRSAIITGRYPHQTGMFENDLMLPPDIPCMTDVYKDAGYRTYYVGKWHMDGTGKGTTGTPAAGFVPKNWRRRGIDRFDGMNRGHSYFSGSFMLDDNGTVMAVPPANPAGTLDQQLADFEPHRQTDLTLAYLADHAANHAGEPFFIWLNFGPPHDPFTPPAPFARYSGASLTPRPNNPSASNMTALANYYGLCEALDHEFGRLLDRLDALGLADNTIVIFTADHGEMMGSHDLVRKGFPEEESWRVPFLARLPGTIASGMSSDVPFSSTDIMPTLLAFCGLEIPESVTGSDKSALLRGQAVPEGPVCGENDGGTITSNWRAIVERVNGTMFKYVSRLDPSTRTLEPPELYDLDGDPFELTNLASDPAHAAVLVTLTAALSAWRAETGDSHWPGADTPRAATRYPDTATPPAEIESRMVTTDDGRTCLQVKSISRVFLTLEESPDLTPGSWAAVGPAKHGNGNWLNFELPLPPLLGIPRMFYRVRSEETVVGSDTEFINGGNIAGVLGSDWSDGAPSASNPGTIGLDIVSGSMDGSLDGQVITQLGGTILVKTGVATDRYLGGTTKYTLVDGVFRRTTAHVLRIGQNTTASDVEFNIVGGLLDLSTAAGSTGLVFMGTDSVLNVSGGRVDVSGNTIQLHTTSAHTDTPIINFVEEGNGTVVCANLTFNPGRAGYINFEGGTTGSLTVTGTITNDGIVLTGTRAAQFAALFSAGRLRFNGSNSGVFTDVFTVAGNVLSLR